MSQIDLGQNAFVGSNSQLPSRKNKNNIFENMLSTKKMHRVRVKFYLGQNENCSLGECSTSASSEEQFQRGSGGRSTCKMLVKGEFSAIKRLTKGFLLVKRSWDYREGFSTFLDKRRYKDWDHEISF